MTDERKTTETHQKIKLQDDYQTTRETYTNCTGTVFSFRWATADEVGAVEATVVSFTHEEIDLWPLADTSR